MKKKLKEINFHRQELHNHLPSLRTINSLLPYTIEKVRIESDELRINRKEWTFCKNPEQEDDEDSNERIISIFNRDTHRRSPNFSVNKSSDEAFEKCFSVYLKNDSTIKDFDLSGVPKFLYERDESDGFKLNISKLRTNGVLVDVFDYFIRFVNLDNLEYIHLVLSNKVFGQGDNFGILERPEIVNCKNLDLYVIAPKTAPINYITGLKNQTLVLNQNYFDVNDLRLLIENWKISSRPVGTSFCLWACGFIKTEILNSLELQDTFPVEIQDESTKMQGIGMKMDNNRDLVLYQGQHQVGNRYRPALKMEVISRGSEKKIGDSEPHVSG
ncbi:hypothetical protein CRE_17377 [Caenorhabditis remanei]|uniref:F-box associated domain-containing protein n=1 Tax=Caenorhabditis remanei TaxID=31234 RepID=E3N205_CAERE|nr:hypothetical protein CRE_17377 [Caenorhabditis remanei]